jgi:hypothetical protein
MERGWELDKDLGGILIEDNKKNDGLQKRGMNNNEIKG